MIPWILVQEEFRHCSECAGIGTFRQSVATSHGISRMLNRQVDELPNQQRTNDVDMTTIFLVETLERLSSPVLVRCQV